MKKLLTLTLAATLLLASLTSCRMPEKKDPFKEILEENPEMELPKSEVMEVDPENIPTFEINDALSNYEEEMTFDIPAEGDHAAGKLVVKYKIYDFAYEDRNVAVVSVENHSTQALTVSIEGLCEDTLEGRSKSITRDFEGFAAGWQNHFVFIPQIQYDAMEYTLDVKQYTGEMYFTSTSGYVLEKIYEDKGPLRQTMAQGDYDKYSHILAKFVSVGMPKTPYLKRRVAVVFDNNGEIAAINTQRGSFSSEYGKGYFDIFIYAPPVPTKEPLDWPEELDGGVTGIVGILQDELIE